MKRIRNGVAGWIFFMMVLAGHGAQPTAFFRILSSANSAIIAFGADGALVWTNAAVEGVRCTVQRATTLAGAGNWVDFTTLAATNTSMSLRVFDPIAPAGMVLIPEGVNSGTDPDDGGYSLEVSSFYMDRTEVTKAQWDVVYEWAVTNGYSFDNVGSAKAADHPVQTVNWYDCVKWCNARSEKEGRTPCYNLNDWSYDSTADGYRLPTGVEWEYAARGGLVGNRFPWGDTITHDQANYYGYPLGYDFDLGYEGYDTRYAVGEKPFSNPVEDIPANGFGLYGMAGNVWEWCTDWNEANQKRNARGGGWDDEAIFLRCRFEVWYTPDSTSDFGGFRTVCR